MVLQPGMRAMDLACTAVLWLRSKWMAVSTPRAMGLVRERYSPWKSHWNWPIPEPLQRVGCVRSILLGYTRAANSAQRTRPSGGAIGCSQAVRFGSCAPAAPPRKPALPHGKERKSVAEGQSVSGLVELRGGAT